MGWHRKTIIKLENWKIILKKLYKLLKNLKKTVKAMKIMLTFLKYIEKKNKCIIYYQWGDRGK